MSNGLSALLPRVESLVRSTWGASASVRSIAPLAGDASSRRYARVSLAGDAPPTAVVMIQSDSGLSISSDELAVFSEPLHESPFVNVQRYLRAAGVAVPEVHGVDGELLLLEDVGDVTLWDAAGAAARPDGVARLYRAAIDELVRFEVAGERRPQPGCIAFQQRFDERLFAWELEHFLEYGFTGRSVADADLAALRREFAALAAELAAGPTTLAHRDYHSWNLFVHEGRIRVIDFQDALLAPLPYDLATLLNDRATPRLVTAPLERELVAHFLARRAAEAGSAAPLEEFLPHYYRFVFQKSLKIVGRFHYLETVKGRTGYVAMLPDTFATLRRCFESLPALEPYRTLLVPSFPELA